MAEIFQVDFNGRPTPNGDWATDSILLACDSVKSITEDVDGCVCVSYHDGRRRYIRNQDSTYERPRQATPDIAPRMLPMESAPKDGSMVIIHVVEHGVGEYLPCRWVERYSTAISGGAWRWVGPDSVGHVTPDQAICWMMKPVAPVEFKRSN